MPLSFFSHDNAEELVAISGLALSGLDRLLGFVPPADTLPSSEIGALVRLISSTASFGAAGQRAAE